MGLEEFFVCFLKRTFYQIGKEGDVDPGGAGGVIRENKTHFKYLNHKAMVDIGIF